MVEILTQMTGDQVSGSRRGVVDRPTLITAHNKILAAQLYGELKELFPDAAVHYFVSYYDHDQPEAYVPSTDTFIEKDSILSEEIDRMRHAATSRRGYTTARATSMLPRVAFEYGQIW